MLINIFIFPAGNYARSGSPGRNGHNMSPSGTLKTQSLEDINEQLKDIRLKRLELSMTTKISMPVLKSIPVDVGAKKKPAVKTKKGPFFHPNLEYVVEKIIHSPYLTKPTEKYPGKYDSTVRGVRAVRTAY